VRDELEAYAAEVLGPCHVTADRSWNHGEACVLELRTADGVSWYAKRSRGERNYRRERTAYLSWVPALADRAPRLRAYDDTLRALVVSAVDGRPTAGSEPDLQHQAGVLLRRYHEAAPPESGPEFADQAAVQLEHWIARGGCLVDRSQAAFARSEIRLLADVPAPARVPCHRDYTPRNWLVDAAGTLRVIDFGHAKRDVWVIDLARMWTDTWVGRPDLREAFLDGYGRHPDRDDLAVLRGCCVLGAVSSIVWAREHRDASFEAHHRRLLDSLMRDPGF